jgi:hypothetical protein
MRSLLVLVPALAALTLAAAVSADPSDTLYGSGTAGSSVRSVAAFRSIELDGSVDLEFRVGPTQRVEIVADDNLLPYITTTVKDGSLKIGTAKRSISTRKDMKAIVVAPDLGALAINGSGDADVDGLASRRFALSIRGSGDVELQGTTDSLGISVAGSGDIAARGLVAQSAAVDVRGSGDVDVTAQQSVAVTVNGSGDVTIYGKPKSVARKVNGSGSIEVR